MNLDYEYYFQGEPDTSDGCLNDLSTAVTKNQVMGINSFCCFIASNL